jgi:hypothetical protein
LKIVIKGRQQGKTTELINFIVDNLDCIMFVDKFRNVKRLQHLYPYLKERIFAINSVNYLKFPYKTKAVCDDCEFYNKEKFRDVLNFFDVKIITSSF